MNISDEYAASDDFYFQRPHFRQCDRFLRDLHHYILSLDYMNLILCISLSSLLLHKCTILMPYFLFSLLLFIQLCSLSHENQSSQFSVELCCLFYTAFYFLENRYIAFHLKILRIFWEWDSCNCPHLGFFQKGKV